MSRRNQNAKRRSMIASRGTCRSRRTACLRREAVEPIIERFAERTELDDHLQHRSELLFEDYPGITPVSSLYSLIRDPCTGRARPDACGSRYPGYRRGHVHRAAVDRGRRDDPPTRCRRAGVRPTLRPGRHPRRPAPCPRQKRPRVRRRNRPLRPCCGLCRGRGRRSGSHAQRPSLTQFILTF